MRAYVNVNLRKLLSDTTVGRYGSKHFGMKTPWLSSGSDFLRYLLVEKENARFVNIYGLFVDANSGDIALGLFPDPNRYISIGNFYSILASNLFNLSSLPDGVSGEYLLECLKIGYEYADDKIWAYLRDVLLETTKKDPLRYDSIVLNFSELFSPKKKMPEEWTYFEHAYEKKRYIKRTIKKCFSILKQAEKVSVQYFGAFIVEENSMKVLADVDANSTMSDLFSKDKNLESLFLKYLSYDIPVEFLLALKSYGMGIKQRKLLYTVLEKDNLNENFLKSADILSSMYYMADRVADLDHYNQATCFNIINLVKSIGREIDLFFALDLVMKYKNKSVFENLEKKFSLTDILLECSISEGFFVRCLHEYMTHVFPLISRGSLYTRKVTTKQYNMVSFSPYQIQNAGIIFERVGNFIAKKI